MSVEISAAEQASREARAYAISQAQLAKTEAETVYNEVIAQSKVHLAKLQQEAAELKQTYEIKMSIVGKAQMAAQEARALALSVQTQAASEAAVYKEQLYEQAQSAALVAKQQAQAMWAKVVSFSAEYRASQAKARATLLASWRSAEERMMMAVRQVSGIQEDVVAKARVVVESAQRQALVLIKAREAAHKATNEARAAEKKARAAWAAIQRDGASAQSRRAQQLEMARTSAKLEATAAAEVQIKQAQMQ